MKAGNIHAEQKVNPLETISGRIDDKRFMRHREAEAAVLFLTDLRKVKAIRIFESKDGWVAVYDESLLPQNQA